MRHGDVSRETFLATLREDLAVLGLALNDDILSRQADLYELLLSWNRTHNLTRITHAAAAATRHFAESLMLLAVPDLLVEGLRCADVGSGAGFPGLPLAIARPDLAWTLIERTGKKAAFLSYAAATLGLSHVVVVSADATAVSGPFDIVVSRAVAPSPPWRRTLASLCEKNGKIVLYLSPDGLPSDDTATTHQAFLRGRQVSVAVSSPRTPLSG